jgi:hypothetical protein
MGEAAVDYLQQVGIRCRMVPMERAAFASAYANKKLTSGNGIGQAAIGASVAVGDLAQAQQNPAFRIEDQFAAFMRDLGGSSDDGGGQVTFTGRDPFVQSRFRTGACMAIPAMGAGILAPRSGASALGKIHLSLRSGHGRVRRRVTVPPLYLLTPW